MAKKFLKILGTWFLVFSAALVMVRDFDGLDSLWNRTIKVWTDAILLITGWLTKDIAPVISKHWIMFAAAILVSIGIVIVWPELKDK